MNRIELLLKELAFTYDQEDWSPPLQQALAGLTAAQASWRPPGEAANTIWEIVSHLLYYKERLLVQLQGKELPPQEGTNNDTFVPSGSADDEAAWQATVARAGEIHRGLLEVLSGLQDADFDRPAPKQALGMSVTSIVLHDVFHTGQIIQIRKLQGSWPAKRLFG